MPELPEVETLVRDLRPQLLGREIRDVRVEWPGSIAGETVERFRQEIVGRRIRDITRRGKFLVFALDDGRYMLIHLRMTGQLLLCEIPGDWQKHVRVTLVLDDGQELCFRDTRKFGRIYLVDDPDEVAGKLGPEPLSAEFDEAAFVERLAHHRGMLKPLLLDQRFIAGLGNIYVDEALFEARLSPRRRAETLSRAEAIGLYHAIRRVLAKGIENRGTTLSDFSDSHGEPGQNQESLAVFHREEMPCPRCRTKIVRDRVGGRGTYYCPHCQA